MKTCSQCQISLPLECFAIQSTGKQGRRADCKSCVKRFIQSPKGLVKAIFGNQKSKSKKRGHPAPAYTEEQLFSWFWAQPNAQSLYDLWIISNYQTDLKPSVDRIDDYKPYTLGNIQLTTVKKNIQRYYTDAVNGSNMKSATPVAQYTLDGVFITYYHSYSAAARAVNGLPANIRNVAEGTPLTRKKPDGTIRSWVPSQSYGYIWRKP